jgi:hypothetical protein
VTTDVRTLKAAALLAAVLVAGGFFLAHAGRGMGVPSPAQSGDPCLTMDEGQEFQVDVSVKDVQDLLAWEFYFTYNRNLISITSRDVQLLLLDSPASQVIDISEQLPDSDGIYRTAAADIGGGAGESGDGTLARLDLLAKTKGIATLDLPQLDIDGDGKVDLGPTLTDTDGQQMGDENGDGFYDGLAGRLQVAIGEPCPTPVPEPSPTSAPGPTSTPGATPAPGETPTTTPPADDEKKLVITVHNDDADDGDDGSSSGGAAGTGDNQSGSGGDGGSGPRGTLGSRGDPSSGDGFAYWLVAPILAGALLVLGLGYMFVSRRGTA